MKTLKNYSPKTKVLSLILSFLIVFYLVPASVYAEGVNIDTTVPENPVSANEEASTYTPPIYEVTELREEYVKHFRLEDGSYVAAQYNYPVHYTDENGQFIDIDNRLIDSGSELSTSNSRVKFVKKITGNGNIYTLHDNNTKITVGLVGAEKKTEGVVTSTNNSDDYIEDTLGKMTNLENISSAILYENILDGVDIEYVVHSLNIKENIIVKERMDSYSYTFTIELNNLTATLADDGNVYINSDDGETQYIIPAPIVFDANDEFAPKNLSGYTLTSSGNGKYELTVTVSSDWMNSSDRAFPVTIDPAMLSPGGAVVDLSIDSGSPDSNQNNTFGFYISSTQRAYLKFDANYFTTLPVGTSIMKAELTLKGSALLSGSAKIGVYPITSDWDATLTWNKTISATPEGSFGESPLDYTIVDRTDTRYSWDITSLYKDWISDGTNYGVGLRLIDESSSDHVCFMSYDNQGSDASDYRKPAIMVTYIHNDGLESYYPTATHSAGAGGVGSINLSTGRLTFAIPTLTTTDSLFAFTPTLVYNSSLAGKDVTSEHVDIPFATSYMPKGFKLNIQETIVKKNYKDENNATHYYYVLYDADGTTHNFFSNDNTNYYDDSGLRLALTLSDGDILIEDTSHTIRTYSKINSTSWHLTSITDKYGNQLIFEFNDSYQPTTVKVKPNGLSEIEMLSLLYENDKLIAVCNDASKNYVIINYLNGNLSKVRYCYGNDNTTEQNVRDTYNNLSSAENVTAYASAIYTFNGSGYITAIRDLEANQILRYETSNAKISRVTQYANNTMGQQVSYIYGEGYTDVRSTGNDEILDTPDDIITRYVFDKYGRSVSVYSMSADGSEIYGATSGSYEEDTKVKNSLKANAVLHGVNPEDIIESESDSGEYFATIQGGIDTDDTSGVYKQTVFYEEDVALLTESNANMEYIISGFGYSNSMLQNEHTNFSLGINVYYYQGADAEDEVVTYSFDFSGVAGIWQYVCGKFNCKLESTETANYDYVRKIEVVCSYYGHLDVVNESAYAHFKDIALTSFKLDNGFDYSYDEFGNLEAKENSLYQEYYTYDPSTNKITLIQTSDGQRYEYSYTEESGITTHSEKYYVINNINNSYVFVSETVYIYDSFGLLTNTSYSGEVEGVDQDTISYITTEYDYITESGSKIFGALYSETDSLGHTTIYDIDSKKGWLLHSINLSSNTGYKYDYYYDGTLRSVKPITVVGETIVENDEEVVYSYYANGELYNITTQSTAYHIRRDNFSNPLAIEIGNRTLATYEYYPNNGKLKKINYGNGFSEEYVYNTLEMLSEVWYTYDDGTKEKTFSYTYNPDGTLAEFTDHRAGQRIKYTYDVNGRLERIEETDAGSEFIKASYSVNYNAEGRISSKTQSMRYYSSSMEIPFPLLVSYEYGDKGALLHESHNYLGSGQKIYYTYDGLNRISSVYRDMGDFDYTTEYSYLGVDNDGVENTSSYLVDSFTSTVGLSSTTYYYNYDSNGNISRVVNGNIEINYIYDDLGQLIREEHETASTNYEYTYDDAGNITSITKVLINDNPDDDFIQLRTIYPIWSKITTVNLEYTDSQWGDLLTSYDGTAITYDEIGNPLSYYNGSAYTFTWEGRKLIGAVKGSNTMSFTYNDEGIRTSKTVDNVKHTYHLNDSQILAEEWEDKLVFYLYDASGLPIGMMYRTMSYATNYFDVFWFEKNLQGDIVAVYDEDGTKVATYKYSDAWGDHSVSYSNGGGSTGAQYNPFRYRGYYYDTDLGMYYLQSRYYDAKICRFINADSYVSTGQGILGYNMFAYCGNNPVNYVDYSGEWFVVDDIAPLALLVSCMFVMLGLIQDAMGDQILVNFVSDVVTQTAEAVDNLVDGIKSSVESRDEDKSDVNPNSPENGVVFPANPLDFTPLGLIATSKPGTKNGAIIYWTDPSTKKVIFRWDANPNYDNGPHYHIVDNPAYSDVHFYSGMTIPEPYATQYFPVR